MILGIIPARGSSKGIPRKNMRAVAGKPLLLWTIEHARGARLLDHFLVSTEDKEIGKFTEANGAQWWKRPAELATDEASTLSVLQDVVANYPKDIMAVVVLQPTSPVRLPGLIDKCIQHFLDNKLDSIATGFIDRHLEYGRTQHYRRQEEIGRFCDDGNAYVIKADIIRRGDRIGKKIGGMIVSREENLEIDEPADIRIAENILAHGLKGEEGPEKTPIYGFINL